MATKSLPERVSALEETVSTLHSLPQELAAFRIEVHTRFAQADDRFESLERHLEDVRDQLSAQMRMLYEDLVERIMRISEARDSAGPPPARSGRRKAKA
jgi:hypothetical protein